MSNGVPIELTGYSPFLVKKKWSRRRVDWATPSSLLISVLEKEQDSNPYRHPAKRAFIKQNNESKIRKHIFSRSSKSDF